jgi:hypothetical protein
VVYIAKRRGEREDPCGVPCERGKEGEVKELKEREVK